MTIRFQLNGREVSCESAPDRRAVDLLREEFGLFGVKEGCGGGECGACAVLVDGAAHLSCLMLAAQLAGRAVVTVEGLGTADTPHPLQQAFAEHGAVQCGYCTPGMVVAATDLLARNPAPDRASITEAVSGTLCRCGGYDRIVTAVEHAARAMRQDAASGCKDDA